MVIFPKGLIKIKITIPSKIEKITLAEYVGRQRGFECIICGKGENCYTFNLYESELDYKKGICETWGFGKNHLNHIQLIEN